MKRQLLLLIIFIIIISGCNNEKTTNESTSPAFPNPTLSSNIIVDIDIPDDGQIANKIEIIYPAYNGRKYSGLIDWQSYISEKFGIEIFVNYKAFSLEDLTNSNDSLNGIIYLNFERGLVYQFNTDVLRYGDVVSYELSPFYKKYNWYEFIDDEYINSLTMNGGIYAVPTASYRYIIPRYYNENHLDSLNLDVPKTIDELYHFLKQTRTLYPDINTFYPMCISAHSLAPSTADIFRAYNVYINTEFNTSISFNPNTGTIEDGAFSEDFAASLEFIRQLQHEKLLLVSGFRKVQLINGEHENIFLEDITSLDKAFATEYNYIYSAEYNFFISHALTAPNYSYREGFFIDGLNTVNTCEVRNDMAFYVFPKTLKNINGTMEMFNDIFTNADYYADLKYGILNENYSVNNNRIIINKPSSGDLIDLKQISYADDNNACYVPSSIEIIDALDFKTKYEQNIFNHLFTIATPNEKEALKLRDSSIQILFNGYISAIEAIDEYKNLFKKSGKLHSINQINERLGTVSQYDYGN